MTKPFRFYLAQFTAKCTLQFMRLLRRNATVFPGRIAMKIDPRYIEHVDKPTTVFAVTGTNGKTTTANLVSDQLDLAGKQYMHNRFGSNVRDGIASSFVEFSTLGGKNKKEYAVLELDERSAIKVFDQLTPHYLLITNLFRDSYARNAHADYISWILEQSIPDQTKLVVNTDDLISARLKPNNPRIGFSIPLLAGEADNPNSRIKDLVNCPVCHHQLTPEFIRYNHIGRYICDHCSFTNPEAEYEVAEADLQAGTATIRHGNETENFHLSTNNIVDVYNLLGATALLTDAGLPLAQQARQSKDIAVTESRFDQTEIGGKRVLTILAKACNPIASSRTFDYIRKEAGTKSVVLANSEIKKGNHNLENIGWIYDNDFSYLNDPQIKQIICCGKRYLDFALCLALAGVPQERVTLEEDFDQVPQAVALTEVDSIFILKDLDTEEISKEIKKNIIARIQEQA